MSRLRRAPVACGIDIGTTNIKVVAMEPGGAVVARATCPTPRIGLTWEVDALALHLVVEELVGQVCGDRYRAEALASSGVGEDGVLVDEALQPLGPVLAWCDPRRDDVFADLRAQLGPDPAIDVSSDAARTVVGWAWAVRQPDVGSAASWVAAADLPTVLWSGRPFLSETLAARTAAWSSENRSWDPRRVRLALGRGDLLPPVLLTGEVVGTVRSSRLVQHCVVAPDAVLVAGGHDHTLAGWGVRRVSPGCILDSMGTAEVVVGHSPEPRRRTSTVDVAPAADTTGRTLLTVEELGRNLQWASRDADVAREMHALMQGLVEPDVENTGRTSSFRLGSRGGGEPMWARDAPSSSRRRAEAVLQALAEAGRDAIQAVRSAGAGHGEVRATGGWMRSPGWLRIKERVVGEPLTPVSEPYLTAAATALIAGEARQWQPDPWLTLGERSA